MQEMHIHIKLLNDLNMCMRQNNCNLNAFLNNANGN